jgi:hypothetical protein
VKVTNAKIQIIIDAARVFTNILSYVTTLSGMMTSAKTQKTPI